MLQGFSPQNSLDRRVYGRSQRACVARRPSRTRAASYTESSILLMVRRRFWEQGQDVMSIGQRASHVGSNRYHDVRQWLALVVGNCVRHTIAEFFAKTVVRLKQAAIASRTETIRPLFMKPMRRPDPEA